MAPPNRPVDLPKSTNDTACFFFWLQNPRDCILLLVDISWWKIPLIFVPSQRIENRWTSDGKREFSRWFWFKWKVRQSGRFLAWKTSEKRLFYRLKRNYFTFRLFGMLHRQITKWKQNHKKRKYKVVKWVKSVTSKHYSIFFFHSYFLLL